MMCVNWVLDPRLFKEKQIFLIICPLSYYNISLNKIVVLGCTALRLEISLYAPHAISYSLWQSVNYQHFSDVLRVVRYCILPGAVQYRHLVTASSNMVHLLYISWLWKPSLFSRTMFCYVLTVFRYDVVVPRSLRTRHIYCYVLFNKVCLNRHTWDIPVKSSWARVRKTFDI